LSFPAPGVNEPYYYIPYQVLHSDISFSSLTQTLQPINLKINWNSQNRELHGLENLSTTTLCK